MKAVIQKDDGTKVSVPYVVSKVAIPGLSGKNIKQAGVIRGNMNEPQISFKFDSDGAKAFGDITKANVGRQLAMHSVKVRALLGDALPDV